jgi:hypothetical protein
MRSPSVCVPLPSPTRRRALALGGLIVLAGCPELTRPLPKRERAVAAAGTQTEPPTDAPAALVDPAPGTPPSTAAAAPGEPGDQIDASHILIAYAGATRAKPTVVRSKEEALQLATRIAAEAGKPGADFARLARESSDSPSGAEGGALPRFGRRQMVKPFSDAAFALQPGEVSGVVETNFGFHIIKRSP